jgi:phosphatidylglycerol:prolipoprotein diacylglycerol transferase
MNPFIITLFGPLAVSWYGLFVVLGVSLFIYCAYNDMRRSSIASTDTFFDCALAGVFGGLLGGKLLFLAVHYEDLLSISWSEAAAVVVGGFAILGAIVGAALGIIIIACWHRIDLLPLLDLAGAYALLAHGVARIGCFIAGCCYGVPVAAGSFFSIIYRHEACLAPLHQSLLPVQLVMSVVSLFGFAVCYYAYQMRGRRDGFVFSLYVLWETASRFGIDFLRGDREGVVYGLSMYQWLALVIIAVVLFFVVVKVQSRYARRRW